MSIISIIRRRKPATSTASMDNRPYARLLIVSLLAAGLLTAACQTGGVIRASGDEGTKQRMMNEIEKTAGINLPDDAKLIYEGDEDRDGDKIKRRIIRARSIIELPGTGERLRIPAESVLRILQKLAPGEAPRAAVGGEATICEWSNEGGGWRASLIQAEQGYFLDLEQFLTGNEQ